VDITYEWRGRFSNAEVSALHAEGFGGEAGGAGEAGAAAGADGTDWRGQVERHSLGWVCAWQGGDLVGFVNVPWDGGVHAFIMDTVVAARAQRRGVGTALVALATEQARAAGCEWLHVDFEEHLAGFYFRSCGFTPTPAGLIPLHG
jgi:GNAT superfamily N-acetyltransferase